MTYVRRLWVLAPVVVFALAAGGPAGGTSAHCAQSLPHAPALPAPTVVTTRCGRFRLQPDGNVVYKGSRTSPVPRVADVYWPQDLTWAGFTHNRHLLIGRGLRLLWRSHASFPETHPGNVEEVVLGRRHLAFSYYADFAKPPRLYVARFGAAERAVARDEIPTAFLRSDRLVTWRRRTRALLLRVPNGRLDRVIAPRAVEPQWDRGAGIVLFRRGRTLRAFDGREVRVLLDRYALGVRGTPVVEPLGRFVALHDSRRLVVVDYGGRLVASTPLPKRRDRRDGVSSSLVANAGATAVAFTATNRGRGTETVYVLGRGATRALARFTTHSDFRGCGYTASVAWHGRWLLYSNAEPGAVVVDGDGQAPAVRLTDLISRLPGVKREGLFNIAWAPAP